MHSATLAFALLSIPTAVLAATFDVTVGQDQAKLVYEPEYVNAHPGDTINFTFFPKNHTVTQSSFENPCNKWDGGVASGFQPVSAELLASGNLPTFQYHVVDSQSKYFYCGQRTHCGKGMVFSVNPSWNPHTSFEAFKNKALAFGIAEAAAASSSPAPAPTATEAYTFGGEAWTVTYSPHATPTPTPKHYVHEVLVGEDGGFTYNPTVLHAAVGDSVKYTFTAKNHTVTRSSFAKPCTRLETPDLAFDSGFMPVVADQDLPTFTVKINDTAPVYVYCRQGNHCSKEGMVMIINETADKNFAAFKALAIAPAAPSPVTYGN